MNKRDYHKDIIKKLKHFRYLKLNLKNLEERLAWRKEALKEVEVNDLSAISYDSIPISKTYQINSATENEALRRYEILEEVELEIKETKYEIERFEQAMELLEPIEKKIVLDSFIERKPVPIIVEELGYSERRYWQFRDIALSKMCTAIFGVRYYKIGLPLLEEE